MVVGWVVVGTGVVAPAGRALDGLKAQAPVVNDTSSRATSPRGPVPTVPSNMI